MEYRQTRPRLFASASSSRACDSVTVRVYQRPHVYPPQAPLWLTGMGIVGCRNDNQVYVGIVKQMFGSETTVTVGQSAFTFVSSLWRLPPVPARACPQSGAHGRFARITIPNQPNTDVVAHVIALIEV